MKELFKEIANKKNWRCALTIIAKIIGIFLIYFSGMMSVIAEQQNVINSSSLFLIMILFFGGAILTQIRIESNRED